MEHLDQKRAEAIRLLAELNIELSEPQLSLALKHLKWVLGSRERLNLTAVSDPFDALRLHLIDSLTALPEVVAARAGEMLDLGTGGGFPGIPLAIASGRKTTLLDSVRKKSEAVAVFVHETHLDVSVAAERSEEHALANPERYSVVVARAVASLPVLVELASPLLALHGTLICLKGRPEEEEVTRGTRAAEIVGLELRGTRQLQLPGGDECREIVVFEKHDSSTISLPRRPGRAQKKPLA